MGPGAGGYFKTTDNVIAEVDSVGNKKVRFQPVPAWETQDAIDALCKAFDETLMDESIDPLIVIPMFVLDFLCIHPFNHLLDTDIFTNYISASIKQQQCKQTTHSSIAIIERMA